ncbi:hypothetical protein IAD21_00942 [Abditibacteriota bacterium]|nr:hypothetical protein IAD21_00942 [Abditibacteriota bacterium]
MKIQTSGGTYTPTPAGTHQAVIVDVIDYGWPQNEFKGEVKSPVPVTELVFQILDTNEYGDRYEIRSKRQNITWSKKSNFPKFLAQIIGQNAVNTIMESGECHLAELVGRNVWLVVEHIEKGVGADKKTYSEITNTMEFNPKQGQLIEPDNYIRVEDRPGYIAPVPGMEDENKGREVSSRPTFVRAGGATYSPPDWMQYREDIYGAAAPSPVAPSPSRAAAPPQKSASAFEGASMGQIGQIRNLAKIKLGSDLQPLSEFINDGFGKDVGSLSKTEALECLSQLRGMADLEVEEEDDDDIFGNDEDNAASSDQIATDARTLPMTMPVPAPSGRKATSKAAAEAY